MPLVIAPGNDDRIARQVQRRAAAGELVRIYQRIYTDDLNSPVEVVVRRELFGICTVLFPGSVISHRSAIEMQPIQGNFFLTASYARVIDLPGVRLRAQPGPEPQVSDIRIPTPWGEIHRSSTARAYLENLQPSRTRSGISKTLSRERVEARLDQMAAREGDAALNHLRDEARKLAPVLGLEREFQALDGLIGTLLGTRTTRLKAPQAIARASGLPYDARRADLFHALLLHLEENPLGVPPAPAETDPRLEAFVESYFSNYIEGTEFEIQEARDVVLNGRPVQYREDDSHDLLGVFDAVLDSVRKSELPDTADAFTEGLRRWNRQAIHARAAKQPGEFKQEANLFGAYYFVDPTLVRGTLAKGFETIQAAATPANRAAIAMFVVSEVHPFNDGNGRTARLAMNAYLSAADLTRIIVPTVLREDYLMALRAHSQNSEPDAYRKVLARCAEFGRWLDFNDFAVCLKQLEQSNAMKRGSDALLRF